MTFSYVPGFGGLILLLVAAWVFIQQRVQARWVQGRGTVVGLVEECDSEGKPEWRVVVAFDSPPTGERTEFKNPSSVARTRYRVGEAVEVLFDPAEPTTAMIAEEPVRGLPVALAVGGASLVALGCWMDW